MTVVGVGVAGTLVNASLAAGCAAELLPAGAHHLAVSLDAGPMILIWTVDGVPCDGGGGAGADPEHPAAPVPLARGWSYANNQGMAPSTLSAIGDIGAGVTELRVGRGYGGTIVGGLLYNRSLLVTEMVGNSRAGPQHA